MDNSKALIEQLDQLSKLRASGAVNEEEFAQLKAKVLAGHVENDIRREPAQRKETVGPARVPNGYALALATFPIWGLLVFALALAGLQLAHVTVGQTALAYGFAAFVLAMTLFLGLRDMAVLDDLGSAPINSGTLAVFVLFYPLLSIYLWRRGTALRKAYGDTIAFPRKHLFIWVVSVAAYLVAVAAMSPAFKKSLLEKSGQIEASVTAPAAQPSPTPATVPSTSIPAPVTTAQASQILAAVALEQIAGKYRRAEPLSDLVITKNGAHWHVSLDGTSDSPNMPADCQIEADGDLANGQITGTFHLENLDRPGHVVIKLDQPGVIVLDADVADCGRGSDLTGRYARVANN